MDITIEQADLADALAKCAGVIDTRSTSDVAKAVLLTAESKALVLECRGGGCYLRLEVPCRVRAEGRVLVKAAAVLPVVQYMPPGEISVLVKQGRNASRLQVAVGTSRAWVPMLDDDDAMPGPGYEHIERVLTMDGGALSQMMREVAPAVCGDEYNPLYGALLELSERVTVVATDGHVLAASTSDGDWRDPHDCTAVAVPPQAARALERLPAEGEKWQIELWTHRGTVSVAAEGPGCLLHITGTGAQWPDWRQMLPASSIYTASLRRAEMVRAVRASTIVPRDQPCASVWGWGEDRVVIETNDPERGDSRVEVSVRGSGSARLGLSLALMVPLMRAMADETVDVAVSGELSPMVMTPRGRDDVGWVLSPMKLR